MSAADVLIVEDDRDLARILAMRLQSEGFRTTLVQDAYHARRILRQDPPGVVLMDIGIPAGDGFRVHQEMRELHPSPIPVIYVTGSDRQDLAIRARALGAHCVFQKPLDIDGLVEAVRECLPMVEAAATASGTLPPPGRQST